MLAGGTFADRLTNNFPGMDMLEERKTTHVVAPGLNWIIATLYEAEAFGYPNTKAEQVGYKTELDAAIAGLREMSVSLCLYVRTMC